MAVNGLVHHWVTRAIPTVLLSSVPARCRCIVVVVSILIITGGLRLPS